MQQFETQGGMGPMGGTLAMLMTRRRAWTVAAIFRATAFWWVLLALLGVNWAYLLWRHWQG